jgi:hypothetical protein
MPRLLVRCGLALRGRNRTVEADRQRLTSGHAVRRGRPYGSEVQRCMVPRYGRYSRRSDFRPLLAAAWIGKPAKAKIAFEGRSIRVGGGRTPTLRWLHSTRLPGIALGAPARCKAGENAADFELTSH